MENINNSYYMGLDMGTDSVGWAVTNKKYEVLKFHSKGMWGTRLYDSANSAAERRGFRSVRRRIGRRKQRIKLLQELFAEEISKVDSSFFLRLKESKYYLEDKNKAVRQPYSLFADKNYTDKQFYKEFPTIYHLRQALIEDKKKYDIRLYYLAIHNIIKNRGHFLFEGMNLSQVKEFSYVYNNWKQLMEDIYDIQITCDSISEFAQVMKDGGLGIKGKKDKLLHLFHDKSKVLNTIYSALAGGKFALSDLYEDESLIDIDDNKISFSDDNYDEKFEVLESILAERIQLLEYLKAIYDWGFLARVLGDEIYLSYAKTKVYNKHKKDLHLLRKVLKEYCEQSVYDEVMKDVSKKIDNYCAYIGYTRINGQKIQTVNKKVGQEKLCAYLKKKIEKLPNADANVAYLKREVNAKTFLPKQVSKSNGLIPYQVHQMELIAILDKMDQHYHFLMERDENGKTVREKIERVFDFRIPYYVGPLNDMHANKDDWTKGNCWIVKKSPAEVLPWNFEEVVDVDASAERFIRRMTNKCTYLVGEDVLPKDSLLYSEFMVLNEINKLKINGQGISVELKQKILNDVFKNKCIKGKITRKKLKEYLITENEMGKKDLLSGIDVDIKSNLTSYQEMKAILGDKVNQQRKMVEDIILASTLFGDDKKLLKRRLYSSYVKNNMISKAELELILKKRYSGWGRLSKAFLEEITSVNKETGEVINIINALRNTNYNLMELLSRNWGFAYEIEKNNALSVEDISEINYDIVDKLQVSSPVKRSIWQSLCIVKEIRKIIKKDPEKLFIEMAREKGKKKRTTSRKQMLLDLYKACKDEERDWYDEISKTEESKFSSRKLFLYYTQMGRCMYSGERITLDSLYNTNIYDKDHIYPRSKTKDDSLDNLVLVNKTINSNKTDQYPIAPEIRKKQLAFWKILKEKKLISEEKYNRLTRNTELSNEELADFINRQIVETRQSTKAVASVLLRILPNTEIVYVKAKSVSDFRHDFGMLKVRELNDLHHAKDAYINIVVGNVYNTKFTNNPLVFLKNKDNRYSLNRMYDFDVVRNGNIAWINGEKGTIKTVKKYMGKNNIQVTRYAVPVKGKLFDQLLLRKGKGQVPIKESDNRLSIEKYGGYNSATGSYFMLVESDGKKGRVRSLEYVPLHMIKRLEESLEARLEYCNNINLINPVILKSCIKMNSLLIVNGFPMYISGRQGNSLIMKGAVQLILDTDEELYLKKIIKCNEKIQEAKKKKEIYKIRKSDNISLDMNIKVYTSLINKIRDGIYSKAPGFPKEILFSSIDTFTNLKLDEQIFVILELLKLYQARNVQADLRLINGSKRSGTKTISKNISNYNSAILRNQSITAMFSTDINLLEL